MTLPLTPEELKQYNNVPTTPLSQKLGDTINELVAGTAYQVEDMAARNALTPSDKEVVRVKSTGELFVYDASTTQWRVVPYSSTRPDFFLKNLTSTSVLIFCDPAGDDISGEGTKASPFASVSRALDSIPNGFVSSVFIVVAPGTYDDRVWNFSATPGSLAPYSRGNSTTEPIIRILGQGHLNGELINIGAGNTTANNIPHPSGSGNYACIKQFNFPTWTAPIPGPLPEMFPVVVAGAAPEYMLMREAFITIQGEQVSAPSSSFVVAPGSDNATGSMHLVTYANLFYTGNYYLTHVDQLPVFPNLRDIIVNPDIYLFDIYACHFGYVLGTDKAFPEFWYVSNLQGCVLSGGLASGGLISKKNFATQVTSCYIRRNPANASTNSYLWLPEAVRGGMDSCYFRETTLLATKGYHYNFGGVHDTSPGARSKIVLGQDNPSGNQGAGPSVGILYFGNIDMIGPGIGVQAVSSSIRCTGSITFDGVSNPLTLSSHSYFGNSGLSIGTCTAPVVVGPMSMTGSASTTTPTSPGIAGWTITNTATPGAEVQVGAAGTVTFGSLPQTDFSLGNTSIGAVAK